MRASQRNWIPWRLNHTERTFHFWNFRPGITCKKHAGCYSENHNIFLKWRRISSLTALYLAIPLCYIVRVQSLQIFLQTQMLTDLMPRLLRAPQTPVKENKFCCKLNAVICVHLLRQTLQTLDDRFAFGRFASKTRSV